MSICGEVELLKNPKRIEITQAGGTEAVETRSGPGRETTLEDGSVTRKRNEDDATRCDVNCQGFEMKEAQISESWGNG